MYKQFEKLIKKHGTTIYGVVKATGIPQTTLYEWKSGRSTPKIKTLKILADYFGVPIEYFLEE